MHLHQGHGSCDHQQGPTNTRAFLVAILANGTFVIFQLFYAHFAHSTSLFADAVHNFGDVLSLVMAFVAERLLKHSPTERTTYGMKKISILAALLNGIFLVFTCGMIAMEALYKLLSPTMVLARDVMIVAGIGIFVNGASALLFKAKSTDLNIRAAFLHLMYDALISLGVVVSAGLLLITGWMWLDPLVGLLIAMMILKGTWFLFANSFRLIIDGVPEGIVLGDVRALLLRQPGVQGVHDLHIWALSTHENAMSVHLWMPTDVLTDEARSTLGLYLRQHHQIHHLTIQVERLDGYCEDQCRVYL
jgi:cobalt-zinc-cadmium efflux system protein